MNRPMNRRLLVAVAVGVLLFEALTGYVLDQYGGEQYWPGLATGFGASLAAFVLALEWERFRDKAAVERAAEEANAARHAEARKRLLALEKELRRNRVSIELLKKRLPAGRRAITVTDFLHPELLDAAWGSSGERLGDLLAEYDLVADLAAFYGRLEELRWRIRHPTNQASDGVTELVHRHHGAGTSRDARRGRRSHRPRSDSGSQPGSAHSRRPAREVSWGLLP